MKGLDDAGKKETVHHFQHFGLDSVSDRCQGDGGEDAECTVFAPEQRVNMKLKRKEELALAGVAQWIELRPANQRVTSSILSQGTCLDCGPGPQ